MVPVLRREGRARSMLTVGEDLDLAIKPGSKPGPKTKTHIRVSVRVTVRVRVQARVRVIGLGFRLG